MKEKILIVITGGGRQRYYPASTTIGSLNTILQGKRIMCISKVAALRLKENLGNLLEIDPSSFDHTITYTEVPFADLENSRKEPKDIKQLKKEENDKKAKHYRNRRGYKRYI